MNQGHYRLAKQSGGIGQYAEVHVNACPGSATDSISISSEAFSWLKDDYGPDAWEWPVCDDYREAAIAGCQYALANRGDEDVSGVEICISKIVGHPAHTTWEAVAFAACFALWDALGLAGVNRPELNDGHFINMPNKTTSESGRSRV